MATVVINGSTPGSALTQMLLADEIVPGAPPSYQLCKTIFEYHPLGGKLADLPIQIAQSQQRDITIPNSPEERVRKAFQDEWTAIGADRHIFNTMRWARVYGIASVALLTAGKEPSEPVDFKALADATISFNVLDPLNTAGSLVLNQDPNSMDFQKVTGIRVSSKTYDRSRSCTVMNEDPIYIAYTESAFGFVGRSVYQRALFPLKSFIQSLFTDDLISLKAGVLIAKQKSPGSIIDRVMQAAFGLKRQVIQEAQTYNVISIGTDEAIETLNLQNLDGAYGMARTNILENIASAAGEPAKLLTQEEFAQGFGEGTEDAKQIAQRIDRLRVQMKPLYDFFDKIVQYRAWNKGFYETLKADGLIPGGMSFEEAFTTWRNSYAAAWPSLLKEPDSELIKVDDVKLKAVIAIVEVLLPALDPENKAILIEWLSDCVNSQKLLFDAHLELNYDKLLAYEPPVAQTPGLEEPHENRPFAANDSNGRLRHAMTALDGAVARLPDRRSDVRDRLAQLRAVVGRG